MMHGVLRACAARIRIVPSALLVPLLALFCATLTPQAAWAASCNPTITLSAVGATANQSFTACDTSLFGFYGGLWESLGVDASANWPIGARPSGPPNEETIDTAKARYGLSADVTTGVYTFRLIQVFNATAPTDTITLYSFVGPVDSSPAFTNTTNTITVNLPAPTITLSPTSLPGALQNIAYSQTVTAAGGTSPYSYAVTAGSLPTGLSLNSSTGAITGTPTGTGTSNFTVTATDNNTFTGNRAYSITVTAAPTITLSPTTLPTPLQNLSYSQTVSASGGTAPYSYAVTAGSLPAGLSLNSSTGAITGTPTGSGAFSFTVTATDANTYTGARAYSGSVTAAPTITLSPTTLPTPLQNLSYSQTVSASGGTAPYSYAVTAGSLPTGLSLNSSTGAITGTPTTAGAFSFTVTATDANTYTGARAYSGSVTVAPTITLSPTTVPDGLQNIAYSTQTISASGGTGPYSYAVTAGSLPAGLSLNGSTGAITGTPTGSGAFSFTVTATDANTYTGARAYSGTITAAPTIALSPTTVPAGEAGTAYSQTLSASGGTASYSYAVTSGSLPTGVTLNSSTGALSGTPTVAGTFNFTVTATDANTYMGSRAYSLTINAPTITLSPTTVPAGTAGTAYSQTVTATGGAAPYGYAVTAGALPTGVTLNSSTGALSGTPTVAGTFNFTVTATDDNTFTGSRAYSLTISAPTIALSPTSLPAGLVSSAYSQTISASGGTAPYGYAVTAGALPTGVTLNSSTGALSGTPTVAGTFNFTVTATDDNAFTGARAYSLTINAAPTISLSPTTVPAGQVGLAYSQTLTAGGGTAPYSYAVTAGSLPAGLSLNGSSGALTGTPSAAGSFNFTVTATDDNAFTGAQAYALTINAAPTITLSPSTLPDGAQNLAYSQTVTASGGTAPYGYAVTVGALPAGLSLNSSSGAITGTPTTAGAFSFTITATDANTYTGSRAYTGSITAVPTIALAPTTLSNGQVGTAYSQTVTATGGTAPYGYAVTAGSLPAGLSLNSSLGAITGTPTTAGAFSFTVTATDANTYTGSRAYTGTINPVPTVTITLSPTTIPDGQVTTAYSQSVTATGGTAPYGYAVTAGSLPAGLSLNSSSGAITGTPTTAGGFSFTITATDAGSHTGSQAYTGNITAAPTVTITLAPSTLPGGQVGTAYSQTVTATGGTAPYGYTVTTGALPAGLTLNATTGALSGTPTAAGTSNFTITATDAGSHTGQRAYSLAISAMPVAPHHDATVSSGGSSTVNLTSGATGGPFTSAQIVSNSNPSAGSARIESSGGSFSLIFEADPTFNGNVTITYTLSNGSQTSMPATVTFAVVNRPDPSTDAEVRGMLTAQASATRRFASSQINNFQSRLERLHDEGERRRNSFGVGFSSGDSGGNRPLSTEEWEKQRLRPNNRRGTAGLIDPGTTASIDRKSAQRPCCESADSPFGNFAFWTGGFVNFGSRDRMTPQIDHTTVGVSGGVDYRFSDTFIAGVGAGFGNDTSDVGDNGTQSKGEAYSMALYGSWRPTPQTFVDGVLGYSFMNFDSRRFITANSTFANGTRDGGQVFGSLSAGYEYRRNGALLSPYTRLDLAWSRLDAFSESTGGIFALTYGKQNVDMAALAFGIRAEYDVQMSWGLLTPSLRAEYTHDFEGSSLAALGYADTTGTPNLSINVDPTAQDYVTLGVGLDAELNNNWMLGLQYRTAFGQGDERAHAVQVRVGTKF